MKKNILQKWWDDYADEAMVYGLTVLCVYLGGYILKGDKPVAGWLPLLGALVVAILICLLVEVMTPAADTPERLAAKKKAILKRLLISGLAGLASGSVIPAAIKAMLAPLGIEL